MWYRQVSSIQRRIKCPISLIGVPTRNIVDIRISEALLAFKSNIQAVLPEDPKVKINLPKTAQMLGLFFAMQLLFVNTKGQNKYGDMLPYMDIEYTLNGKKSASRIYFELFWDITPKTAINFARILEGRSIKKKKLMTYKNTVFHRIIDGFMMQGGDFEHSNGMGGYSVFEHDKFEDENFIKKHTGPGILSMANAGENTNGSQFFITFSACPHLDGRHVVFGKVRDAIDLKKIARIGKVATNRRDAPISPVKIVDCGFLNKKTYNEDREAVL